MQPNKLNKPRTLLRRHWFFVFIISLVIVASMAFAAKMIYDETRTLERQDALEPFYTPPDPLPPAELASLISEQNRSDVGWVIGPEVPVSWPGAYPEIRIEEVTTALFINRPCDAGTDLTTILTA